MIPHVGEFGGASGETIGKCFKTIREGDTTFPSKTLRD
jgi:hypothetical protein